MKNKNIISVFYISILLLAIFLIIFPFAHDYISWKQINLGKIDKMLIYIGISNIIFVFISSICIKYMKNISIKIQLTIFISYLIISTILLFNYSIHFNKNNRAIWKIASYQLEKTNLSKLIISKIKNPIIQAEDINDVKAEFTADPFLIKHKNEFYTFFEVFNSSTKKGEIGMASSRDGMQWKYEKVVLSESFHLSFPCVFTWNGSYYMIPESAKSKSIRLYKSIDFPYSWKFEKSILDRGNYLDNIIFKYKNLWWLFTSTSNANLYLYYSKSPLDPWKSHPKNPIKHDDADASRMAGNIFIKNDSLIRFAQDDYPNYGNGIRSFYINTIDSMNYKETEITTIPNFRGKDKFSLNGVHSISILETSKSYLLILDEY